MQKRSGKATISMRGNSNRLPDLYFKELVQLYVKDCHRRGVEKVTTDGYEFACQKFLDYLQEDVRCSELTQEMVDDYQMDLASRVKAQTVNSYLFKISSVIHFGKEKGYITEEIQFSHMVYQEHFKDIYTEEEIKKLLVRPKTDKFNEYRTWVIISVFLGTGIRSLELRSIRCKDVNMTDGYINLIHTKSKEPRIVPLSDTLILILQEYMLIRDGEPDDFLFCSIYGEMLGRVSLQTSVARYNQKRGVSKTSIHLFRHTFITMEVREGIAPMVLRRITGHRSLKSLDGYYNHNIADLLTAVNSTSPLEKFSQKNRKEFDMSKQKKRKR